MDEHVVAEMEADFDRPAVVVIHDDGLTAARPIVWLVVIGLPLWLITVTLLWRFMVDNGW